ncbi:MAG: CHASE2 domain-containing protein [Nostoc sp. CmiVER01]|uniref:CHASE2 domain-containing protein n=1 Tax=Nostoc sp. CmiVER01 TaxID=3075384 RepID=UPI002AD318A2|nr:CHASE2 domain-containing protein [Nostoc sp. CmiVER01]MDZ8126168.1 CHASE2 domain-containing protein [Nostoc sp. CmiVER01]
MSKLIVISLEKGNLNDGFFPVTAQLWENNNSRPIKFTGSLPPAPKIAELYKRFQLIYQALHKRFVSRSGIEVESTGLNNVSEVDFSEVQEQLYEAINSWLNSDSFRPIDQKLREKLALNEEFQVIIEASDSLLQRLPWHLWNFIEHYQLCEVAVSTPRYERVIRLPKQKTNKVRILAILGNSQGIDIQQDRNILEQLPNASTVFLVEPSRHELDKWLWDEQGWDILFFAGHSQSENDKGHIHINPNSALTINELKNSLTYAISRGLKIAIFNSCDGLGLARQLSDLQISQIIVMREEIPDLIAQEFLKHFLGAFSEGKSFYLAVRYARSRLQGLEEEFPAASWLPVICQNIAEETLTWQQLCGQTNKGAFSKLTARNLKITFLVSVLITSLITGVRSLGFMQQWELSAFDSMMRMRPDEGVDKRLLVITVTEADIQAQEQRQKSSLSDSTLQKLLQKLSIYKPRAIGLDIYRDFPVGYQYPDLANHLRTNNNFIAICQLGGTKQQAIGISPPPEIPPNRIGFSDVVLDSDLIIRRNLLSITPEPESNCKSSYSLNFQLARQYLAKEGIKFDISDEGYLQLGKTIFKPIDVPTGGYQQFDAKGHQILLNYRSSQKVAKQVSVAQVLNNQFNPNWVKDKIVLIGVDSQGAKDYFLTPYSMANTPYQQIPGVLLQANMVSQILSAVLDKRPLLWVLPAWGEILGICGTSLVAGILAVYSRSLLKFAILITAELLILYGCCFLLLLYGGWMPFLPSALALVITGIGVKNTKNYS